MGLLLHYTDIVLTSGGISSCFNTKKNLFLTNKGGGEGVDSPERLLLLPDQFFCFNFLEYAVMSSNINIICSD